MPENEFEKQVQQKMSELQLAPSADAWEKVEKQIAGKKKRRRVLVWLPLCFVLLGGTAWFYATNFRIPGVNDNAGTNAKALSQKNQELQQKPRESLSLKHATDAGANETAKTASVIIAKQHKPISLKQSNTISPAGGKADNQLIPGSPVKAKTQVSKATTYTDFSETAPPLRKLRDKQAMASPGASLSVNNNRATKHGHEDPNTFTGSVNGAFVKGATGVTKLTTENKTQPENISVDSAPIAVQRPLDSAAMKTTTITDSIHRSQKDDVSTVAINSVPQHHNKKFEWGITVTAGSSGISTAFPGVFEKRLNDAASYSNPQTNGSGNVNSSAPGYTTASPSTNHFAWSAGIVVRRSIGKTWRLVSGLHYTSYATSIQVGGKTMDSLVPGQIVYRNNRSDNFTNRAHFIEIPLAIEKQLGMHSRFSLNAGFAVSVLAASNQLRFDQQANLYYADKTIVDKTQWSFLLGLNYRLLQKKIHLDAGPVLRYQLQNMYNKDITGNGHWFFAGVGASIFFDKRKR